MAVKRYELSEAQWAKIAALLLGKASDPGRTAADNRLFVNGRPWVLRSGAQAITIVHERRIIITEKGAELMLRALPQNSLNQAEDRPVRSLSA